MKNKTIPKKHINIAMPLWMLSPFSPIWLLSPLLKSHMSIIPMFSLHPAHPTRGPAGVSPRIVDKCHVTCRGAGTAGTAGTAGMDKSVCLLPYVVPTISNHFQPINHHQPHQGLSLEDLRLDDAATLHGASHCGAAPVQWSGGKKMPTVSLRWCRKKW